MKEKIVDVVIVGTGCAGLFAALSLEDNKNILLITKDVMENSDSYLAQGGICVLKDKNDFDDYFEDTMRAGHYKNRKESVKIMIEESPQIIEELIGFGVEFDKDENGKYNFTKEAAHSTNRILHHKDVTGKEITSKLIERVKERKNITIMEHTTMIDIIAENNECAGVVIADSDGNVCCVHSKAIVLATGGIGGIFKNSTNFAHITGDSFAIAARHNIELENINYIQIHPTTLYSKKKGRRFLISESVRGEGAILLNPNKERFVDELLPRDVVTNTIYEEMQKFNCDHMYLTMPGKTKEEIEVRFPNIYKACLEEGYDLSKDLVPITPAQHYLMGGIKASVNGETSMKNLFAVGETANNGVHGKNRLASNSLLESLVFAKRAAGVINREIDSMELKMVEAKYADKVDIEEIEEVNRVTLMEIIKKKDGEFYAKWCNNEN